MQRSSAEYYFHLKNWHKKIYFTFLMLSRFYFIVFYRVDLYNLLSNKMLKQDYQYWKMAMGVGKLQRVYQPWFYDQVLCTDWSRHWFVAVLRDFTMGVLPNSSINAHQTLNQNHQVCVHTRKWTWEVSMLSVYLIERTKQNKGTYIPQ